MLGNQLGGVGTKTGFILIDEPIHRINLQQQGLGDVSGRDSRWFKFGLNAFQGLLEKVLRELVPSTGDLLLLNRLQIGIEQSVITNVFDDHAARRTHIVFGFDERPLPEKLIDETFASGRCVGHRGHLAVAVPLLSMRGSRHCGVLFDEVVAVGLLHSIETFEVGRLAVGSDHQLTFALTCKPIGFLPFAFEFFMDGVGLQPLEFKAGLERLEGDVRLELLLDAFLKCRKRHVQNLHRLDHPRAQLHLLTESHGLRCVESHRSHEWLPA